MKKLIDYNKVGNGVSKEEQNSLKKYNFTNYFKLLKRNFWKIMSTNVIFVVCLIPVLILMWLCFNGVLGEKNPLTEYMFEKNFATAYTDLSEKYAFGYNLSEEQLNYALDDFDKIYVIINEKNPDVITSGIGDFDISLFSEDDIKNISNHFENFAEKLGFSVEFYEDSATMLYGEKVTLKFTFSDNSIEIGDTIPYSLTKFALSVLCYAPLILLAPIICIAFRLCRDYVRGEPVFFWHDIWDTFKKNWWQSLLIGLIQYIVTAILVIALKLYGSFSEDGLLFVICFAIALLLTYIFTTMHLYIYLMQVTLDLNLRKIYKNSLLFSVIGLFRNILVVLITAIVVALIFFLYVYGLSVPLIMSLTITLAIVFLFGWWFFTVTYIVYPKIQQLVIDPYYEELSKKNLKNDVSVNDQSEEEADDEEPEYVYYNGKMVHKSIYEKEVLFKDDVSSEE